MDEARKIQQDRFEHKPGIFCNAHMGSDEIKECCQIGQEAKELIRIAITQLGLSARAYDRILKVSRTIADLDGKDSIEASYVAEAIGYRSLDRNLLVE